MVSRQLLFASTLPEVLLLLYRRHLFFHAKAATSCSLVNCALASALSLIWSVFFRYLVRIWRFYYLPCHKQVTGCVDLWTKVLTHNHQACHNSLLRMNLYNMFCNSWNSDLIAMEPYVFAHRPIVNVLLNHRNHYEPEKHTEDNAGERGSWLYWHICEYRPWHNPLLHTTAPAARKEEEMAESMDMILLPSNNFSNFNVTYNCVQAGESPVTMVSSLRIRTLLWMCWRVDWCCLGHPAASQRPCIFHME